MRIITIRDVGRLRPVVFVLRLWLVSLHIVVGRADQMHTILLVLLMHIVHVMLVIRLVVAIIPQHIAPVTEVEAPVPQEHIQSLTPVCPVRHMVQTIQQLAHLTVL